MSDPVDVSALFAYKSIPCTGISFKSKCSAPDTTINIHRNSELSRNSLIIIFQCFTYTSTIDIYWTIWITQHGQCLYLRIHAFLYLKKKCILVNIQSCKWYSTCIIKNVWKDLLKQYNLNQFVVTALSVH